MTSREKPEPERTPAVPRGARKPYRKPQLVEYGSVAKLTQTGGTTRNEPHGFKMPCL
ncbi:MAG TPA: lasso RiPP family leader peptide-containing protein [Vicinamibacterales bacterium]|nr:lasso RiPP family leader peptide-containing protein [Vicinamibacterales bacterium]